MGEPIKLYGNIDLRALRGATVVQNEEGVECLQIPIDIANLKRSGNHLYLSTFTFERKIHNYDFIITRSQTKEERENRQRTEVLGNAIFVKNKPAGDGQSSPPPQSGQQTGGDEPF